MNAEILAVGTELLLGDILNTNAQYLSQRLAALGIDVFYQSVVGDNRERLQDAVLAAKKRCSLLIITGGLGPTNDDLTKQTVASAFNDTLIHNAEQLEKIKNFFEKSGRAMPENNYKQALCPQRGKTINNANGTAPGAIFEHGGSFAVLLPGPPNEMKPMFESEVEPWLAALNGGAMYSRVLRVAGVGESHLEELLFSELQGANPSCALYAKTGEVIIRVTAKAENKSKAASLVAEKCAEIYSRLGNKIYDEGESGIEHTVVRLLLEKDIKIATAESCTGGMLSARLTDVAGGSAAFGYGVCTYSNEAKMQLLGVKPETLKSFGAVSSQTACEMASGVCELSGAALGIGITGIAGPGGGSEEKPVGLVYLAACYNGKSEVIKMLYEHRSRETVRENAVQKALNLARLLLIGEKVVQ